MNGGRWILVAAQVDHHPGDIPGKEMMSIILNVSRHAPEEGYRNLWVDESQEGLHHTKLEFNERWSELRKTSQGESETHLYDVVPEVGPVSDDVAKRPHSLARNDCNYILVITEWRLLAIHLFAHILMRRVEQFKEERDGSCSYDCL